MGFPRQEYCSGLPFPPSGDLLDPGVEPRSPALQVDSLPCEPPRKNGETLSKSQVALVVKNPATNAGDSRDMGQVGSLGWEDPLEKEMATHSSILAWEIPCLKNPWWVTDHGVTQS